VPAGSPGSAGVRRDAEEGDAAGGVLHNEQHAEPVEHERVNAEEVGDENACARAVRTPRQVGPLRRRAGRCRLA